MDASPPVETPVESASVPGRTLVRLLVLAVILGLGLGATWFLRRPAPPPEEGWTPVLTWGDGQILGTGRLVRNWGDEGEPFTLPAQAPAEPGVQRWLVLPTVREPGALRVSVDVEWVDRIDAVEVALHAHPDPTPVWWMVPQGISCQFAGHGGRETSLSFNRLADRPDRQGQCTWHAEPGRRYRLVVEAADGQARISVDGQVLLDLPELLPVSTAGSDRLGLRFWAPVRLHGLHVERRRIPAAGPPIATGDALAASGAFDAARDWYLRVADDHGGTRLAALALVKAAACAGAADDDGTLALIRRRLEAEAVPQDLRDQVDAVLCLQRWRARRWDEALALAEAIQARDPESPLPIHLLAQRRGVLPAAPGRRLAMLAAARPGTRHLDLTGLGLTEVAFLAGRPVIDLDLSSNPLVDLGGLRGLPLERLRLAETDVADIGVLAGMPLRTLDLQGCPVTDLTALRGMDLVDLNLAATGVGDLSVLAGMPLRRLSLARTPVTALDALAGAPLESLVLAQTGVTDLGSLRGSPLRSVDISSTGVRDLAPVVGSDLRQLRASGTPVDDLAPLVQATALTDLDLSGTLVRDLAPLAGLSVEVLTVADTPLHDLAGLQTAKLTVIDLSGTRVTDLGPLATAPLRRLIARGAPVASVRALVDSPVEEVDLIDTRAGDFLLLTQVANLRAWAVTGILTNVRDWEAAAAFCVEAGRPDLARTCRIAAVEDGDPTTLAALAEDHGGVRRLRLGRRVDRATAEAIAHAAGAVLAWPRDSRDFRRLMADIGFHGEVWTALDLVEGVPHGPGGQALPDLPGERSRGREGVPVHLFWIEGDRGISRADPTLPPKPKHVILEWP